MKYYWLEVVISRYDENDKQVFERVEITAKVDENKGETIEEILWAWEWNNFVNADPFDVVLIRNLNGNRKFYFAEPQCGPVVVEGVKEIGRVGTLLGSPFIYEIDGVPTFGPYAQKFRIGSYLTFDEFDLAREQGTSDPFSGI